MIEHAALSLLPLPCRVRSGIPRLVAYPALTARTTHCYYPPPATDTLPRIPLYHQYEIV